MMASSGFPSSGVYQITRTEREPRAEWIYQLVPELLDYKDTSKLTRYAYTKQLRVSSKFNTTHIPLVLPANTLSVPASPYVPFYKLRRVCKRSLRICKSGNWTCSVTRSTLAGHVTILSTLKQLSADNALRNNMGLSEIPPQITL